MIPSTNWTARAAFRFIFTFFRRVTLQQSWFSRGPPLKGKNRYKLKYNPIILTKKKAEKVAQNLKRKINGAMRAWLLASL